MKNSLIYQIYSLLEMMNKLGRFYFRELEDTEIRMSFQTVINVDDKKVILVNSYLSNGINRLMFWHDIGKFALPGFGFWSSRRYNTIGAVYNALYKKPIVKELLDPYEKTILTFLDQIKLDII